MKWRRYLKESMIFCVAVSLISVQPAHAYLDPGTGSAILQGILAAIVAIGVVLKLYWHKLLKFMGIRKDVGSSVKDDN